MSFKKTLGKSFVLILIILILVASGLLWFSIIGINIPGGDFVRQKVATLLGKSPQTTERVTQSNALEINIDDDRQKKVQESLDIQTEALEKRESDIVSKENLLAQTAAELEEREKNLEEREKTFNLTQKKYDDVNVNIEQIANNLNGMRPEAAVNILIAMDDQLVIDVLRKVEELATDGSSMGSYWLSLMPSERAAEIQRKMVSKPESLE